MEKPVLFLVDDEAGVVHALRDDLSRRFGQDFCVAAVTSASGGLADLADLAARRQPVALLIAGHAMAEMPGVDFLARAHRLHPLAKRMLLVDRDYTARSPITQAICWARPTITSPGRGCWNRTCTAKSASSWPNGPRTRRPASSCSTWSGGCTIPVRTRCASCSPGSTCRSTSRTRTPGPAAACWSAAACVGHACRC